MDSITQDYELMLYDRIEVIKTVNKKYDLEHNAYLSFSGGKDSTILHYLLDKALPNNRIPRVFINTGIEYQAIVEFVKGLAEKDDRFILLKPSVAVKPMLEKYGYPFKSKQHSHNVALYQHSGLGKSVQRYLGIIESNTLFRCPKMLEYQFTKDFKLKISDMCCMKMKKEPIHKWEKANNRFIAITGMRQAEGGQRASIKGCVLTDQKGNLKKFHPLLKVDDAWEETFRERERVELAKIYYPPFNFKRSGCKFCPYSLDLQEQLEVAKKLMPNEVKQAEMIWKPVYEEYRRLNYRLTNQMSIFDFTEEDKNE